MTIEIYPAGMDQLLGPAFLGFWRREINQLIIKKIPLDDFLTEETFQAMSRELTQLFESAFIELEISRKEQIFIPKFNFLDTVADEFNNRGYFIIRENHSDYLPHRLKDEYISYLRKEYQIPKEFAVIQSLERQFDLQQKWIAEDFPRRKDYVKQCLPIWHEVLASKTEEDWMKAMIDVPEPIDDEEFTNKNMYSKNRNKSRHKNDTRRKSKAGTSRNSRKSRNNYNSRNSKGSSRHRSNHRYDSRQSSRKNNHSNRNHTTHKKYSSTDPDPKRFFF